MRSRHTWNLLSLVLLVAGAVWIWVNRLPADGLTGGTALPPAPAMGHPAPDFTLDTLGGETFSLSALQGTPVVLNFWATWCPPCRAELPELERAGQVYAGQIAIVGVDQAEPPALVAEFAASMRLTFPVPLDSAGQISRIYGVRSLPTTFFIDRQGVIRHIQVGPLTEATLAQRLRQIYP